MRNAALAIMLLVAAPVASLGQTTLFGGIGRGGGSDRGELITINQITAVGILVGSGATDPDVGLTGLAFDISGDLFASTTSAPLFPPPGAPPTPPQSTLIRLDPLTGAQVALIGTIRTADGTQVVISDLALQPGTGALFGTAINLTTGTNNIYTIDKTTAVATLVGDTGVIGATLAFGPNGTLYQTSAEFNDAGFVRGFLNTLDPNTANVLTTSNPFTEAHIGGLTVRPSDGTIFASGGMESDIYTLTPSGVLTFVGLTGFGGVGDIAFTARPGLFQLVATHSQKCLDVPEWILNDGIPVVQWTCNGGDNQTWSVEPTSDGYARLVARHSGKCLDVSGVSTEDRAEIIQWQCHGGANQQWRVEAVTGGYQLVARHSGKCLDVRGESTNDGGSIIQWSCHGGANQTWLVRPVSTLPPPTQEARQAVAPTGKLRVALQLANPLNVVQDAGSGEIKGVGFDLGKELARLIGVPFEPVFYPSVGALLDGGRSGAWDVAFVGFSPARAEEFDFTGLHVEVEFGYLIPPGSAISTIDDVDRPGVRVAVQQNSGPDAFFTRTLKDAVLIRASSNPAALEAVRSGEADVMGSIKPVLFELSSQLPGSRVLEGRPGIDPHAMAMPKGRDPAGPAYARQFIETAKSEGLVQAAIERAGVGGVAVAPPQ
jgi:polar amino acid transport system substrate-binding protein